MSEGYDLKIGTLVMIRPDLRRGMSYRNAGVNEYMESLAGEVAKITRYSYNKNCYHISNDSHQWHWTIEYLIPVANSKYAEVDNNE